MRDIEREKPLRAALAGVELTAEEERIVQWLAKGDRFTIDAVAGLLVKVREVPHAQ